MKIEEARLVVRQYTANCNAAILSHEPPYPWPKKAVLREAKHVLFQHHMEVAARDETSTDDIERGQYP